MSIYSSAIGSALTMYHGSVRVASVDQMMLINPAPVPTATMSPMATTATPMTTNAQSPMVTSTPFPMTSVSASMYYDACQICHMYISEVSHN